MIVRLRLKAPGLRVVEGDEPSVPLKVVDFPHKGRALQPEEMLEALSNSENKNPVSPEANPHLITPREMMQGLSVFLMPVCAIAYALALWRIGADMGWARAFAIEHGILSHWQVWFVAGGLLQTLIVFLREGRPGGDGEGPATQ